MIRVLLGVLLGAALADMPKPAVVILCNQGAVSPAPENGFWTRQVATGHDCVIHGKDGKTASAREIEVYDQSPPGEP